MSTPLSENPAVLHPRKTLSQAEQNALGAINFFKHQAPEAGGWRIGNKRVHVRTIAGLQRHELVKVGSRISLTQAGMVAAERLKGGGQ
ncbi:hypothetical protein CN154_15215 [Sinorhizobium meliloti]|uniref:hypothetical protein n=1 Tax=Rhizobium meliloti TaxID=382 RepID=UPI000FDB4605|nr:hypothetical protein [Sinorhizobium meliloti]RVK75451.1 hypothetical protein CN154_15215 [Sinorhizobium meliloti]